MVGGHDNTAGVTQMERAWAAQEIGAVPPQAIGSKSTVALLTTLEEI
jgi:hypothetical protein